MHCRSQRLALALLAPLGPFAIVPSALAQQYTPLDLDPAGVYSSATVATLSDGAHPVGNAHAFVGGPSLAVEFRPTGPVTLPKLAGDLGISAAASNAAGVIVGSAFVAVPGGGFANSGRAWVNGQVADLDSWVTTPSPLALRTPAAIDGHGRIVGAGNLSPSSEYRAFLFDEGVVTDLHPLAPASAVATAANRIAESGAIVGWVQFAPFVLHACLWEGGVFQDLNDAAQGFGGQSYALDVDRQGRACGVARFGTSVLDHAALFDHGVMTDLGAFGPRSSANGMNDLGDVVGTSDLPAGTATVAVLWRGGAMTDLNTLLVPGSAWVLDSAADVDDDGRIAGQGRRNGVARPFLLLPLCGGGYTVTAAGCPGPAGPAPTPMLWGKGCPAVGNTIALVHSGGPPGASGFLFLGSGGAALPITASCALSIGPLVPVAVPLFLDSRGAAFRALAVPAAAAGTVHRLQTVLLAPGGAAALTATNALEVAIP